MTVKDTMYLADNIEIEKQIFGAITNTKCKRKNYDGLISSYMYINTSYIEYNLGLLCLNTCTGGGTFQKVVQRNDIISTMKSEIQSYLEVAMRHISIGVQQCL